MRVQDEASGAPDMAALAAAANGRAPITAEEANAVVAAERQARIQRVATVIQEALETERCQLVARTILDSAHGVQHQITVEANP